jgi:hypothetical protein
MTSRMPFWAWLVSIAGYGVLAFALFVFGRTQVAPCFGGVGPVGRELQRRCAENWFANRPIELQLLDSAIPAIVLFFGLILMTAWLTRDRGGATNQAA